MPKDKLKKGEVTRLAIEDAALELYMEHGYHATSMRQIADQAGLALGGIYNHFKSKEEIFLIKEFFPSSLPQNRKILRGF